jgi:hypothetical protein
MGQIAMHLWIAMKRTLFCTLLASACGDDAPADNDLDTGGSTGLDTTDDDGSFTVSDSGSAETTDGGETSSGETTTTESESSSTAADTSGSDSSSGDESSTTGDLGDGCLPPEVFAAIDQHAHDLAITASLLADHPSTNEVTGFLLAPGLSDPPALPSQFASLFMPCSDVVLYEPYCESGRCSQIECTGEGSAWINHMWIEPAIDGDPWSFEEVHLHQSWSGGTGIGFDITTISTGPDGTDMSLTGSGEMDVSSMYFTETFPALHPAGLSVFEYAEDAIGYSGQLTIVDTVVAEVDDLGHLVSTGECP